LVFALTKHAVTLNQRAVWRVNVSFPPDSPEMFQLTDAEGRTHRVPFHRVREVYKDSQRIWHRPHGDAAESG
jgi:MJ1316 RNA cyclic group end recognition domain